MASISVFGIGYVGVVAAACLARDGHDVVAVDIDEAKVDAINKGQSPIVENGLPELIASAVRSGRLTATSSVSDAIAETEASFICVGTPSAPNGAVGTTYVKSVCDSIGAALSSKAAFHSVVVRSTTVPGTTDSVAIPALEAASNKVAGKDFGVGYFPEFLRESTAIEDYDNPGLIVVGAMDDTTANFLTQLNAHLPCDIHTVDIPTAEMVKYTSNTWRAVKVSFANEIGNVAKSAGLDGQRVMQILCSDHKVNMSPYFMRPGFAFGGSCLPKDVRALRHFAKARDVQVPILDAVLEANEAQIARARTMIKEAGVKSAGMIGISFKPGTDDLRESPLAELAARLIEDGIAISIYDPYVHAAYAQNLSAAGRGNDVVPDLGKRLIDGVDALIDGADSLIVGNFYSETVDQILTAAENKPVIDLTRISKTRISDGHYNGICW